MAKTAIVQINSAIPCPAWLAMAEACGFKTVWFTPELDPHSVNPDLVLLQYVVQSQDLKNLGYGTLKCPIVGSCGDAAVITNLDQAFKNLDIMTRLDVEGYDYFDYYDKWPHKQTANKLKFRFLKQCADHHFRPLTRDVEYDWSFTGQVYPAYEERLKHWRNTIIKEIHQNVPNGFVSGAVEWTDILGDGIPRQRLSQPELNELYAKSLVVVSIDAHDGSGYTSTRTIEAMLAGSCVFLYNHSGIGDLMEFEDGVNVFLFSSLPEFYEKFAYVKSNPHIPKEVGAAARRLILDKDWTYSGWLRRALSLCK